MGSEPLKTDLCKQNDALGLRAGSAIRLKKQEELVNWFRRNAESLAYAYEGAIRLLADRGFPGRVHFIAHAVRDIADRLAFALDPQLPGSRVQYESHMDGIEKLWPKLQVIADTAGGVGNQETMTIDFTLASLINSLVEGHRERRQRPSNHELLFRFLMRNEPSRGDVNKRLVSDFKRVSGWFMKLAHFRDKKAPEFNEDELQAQFVSFEGMLHSFVGHFFTGTAELDEILQQANK